MNTNTFEVTGGQTFHAVEDTAVRNEGSSFAQKLVLALVWLAVSLPLIWGVMNAWDEAKNIF
jgi:hypothetical protein